MKIIFKVLFLLFFSLLFSALAFSQSSLVPSYHPVYEWLYMQRIKGNLSYYDYESLPLNRSVILNHLKDLKKNPGDLYVKDRKTLESFLTEFDSSHLDENTAHSLITTQSTLSLDRLKDWIWSDNEKHVFSYSDSLGFFVFDHGFGRRAMFVQDGSLNRKAPYILNQHWRSYGSYKNNLGYHVEFIRGVPVGYKSIFDYDGFYSYNWKNLRPNASENNYHYEAYVTANYRIFEASIGRGNLKEGVGQAENLVFSRSSIATDWVRFNVGEKWIRYNFTHLTLTWPTTIKPLDSDPTVNTKNSPRRWAVYHKLTLEPLPWLTVAAYEMVNYANRGVEIAYINPINRYPFAGWELQDQDNGWVGAYLIIRPVKKLEIYTELLIDDLGHKKDVFFKKKFPQTSRFGRRYGLNLASEKDILVWTEYTRIDPFFYSHPYDLTAHVDKTIGLGSQIGPNADRSEIGIKMWGTRRSFLSLSYSYNRQGLDRFDADGERIFLAGASPNDGRDLQIDRSNLFLDGDLHEWNRFLVKGSYEPKRGYIFELNLEMRKMINGDQMDDLAILWMEFTLGF